jgi:hypothetical protein
MNQARVTGDAAFYARAEAACDRALRLAPDHYDALRLRAWIYGGEHRFAVAAAAARRAHALRSISERSAMRWSSWATTTAPERLSSR